MDLHGAWAASTDAEYILGHSDLERRRLQEQATFMEPLTERFLRDAGLRPGTRVLDVGSGFGDVALLAARLIGTNGEVVGLEREPEAVRQASRRARELAAHNVSFLTGDARNAIPGGSFDAVIGRFVLMYLGDATETVASVARHARPGGIVAFQEWHAADAFISQPPVALWDDTGALLVETFGPAGTNTHVGLQLRSAFERAGLHAPQLRAERLTGGGPDYRGYRYLARVIRTILPMIDLDRPTTAHVHEIDTLERRLRSAAVGHDATVAFPAIVSAWATIPADAAPGS
jgi:ubiquinone/menaquinone biosynthesis C-methylase UbiE